MAKAEFAKPLVQRDESQDALYEFDREPVSSNRLCRAMYFLSSYAGEHTAATEFVIGALFVSWGAGIYDVFLGLLLGNLLAVLSWALICAPIAVRTRLTLYWQFRTIGGPKLSSLYNVLNALAYCSLAGTMVTVSASALRIPFGISEQVEWYPTDLRFVLVVFLMGMVMTLLAILGFKRFAQFSAVCSPWMLIMFLAGALVVLPLVGHASSVGKIDSFSAFWQAAKETVWTGKASNQENQLGFFHLVAFAWICNLGMHFGLSDMAVFRFAKKAHYGLCTSTGMFLGHYVAWISAGVMGAGAAVMAKTSISNLDSGAIGYSVLGLSGAIAVILSGWTTAIPTLYKSGLGLQAVTPNWPRWAVTLVAGIATTAIACFPFVFSSMLNFIALYGLLLLPIGGVVFAEFWLFPKIGLTRYWVAHRKLKFNWPAFVTWVAMVILLIYLWLSNILHQFFQFIPVWILSIVLYIVLSKIAGASVPNVRDEDVIQEPENDNKIETRTKSSLKSFPGMIVVGLVSLVALITCVWMPIEVAFTDIEKYDEALVGFKKWLILPTLIYFVAATFWRIWKEKQA